MHLRKIHHLTSDPDLAIKVRRNITQYPLHHVAYAPAMKFRKENTLFDFDLDIDIKVTQHRILPSTLYIM